MAWRINEHLFEAFLLMKVSFNLHELFQQQSVLLVYLSLPLPLLITQDIEFLLNRVGGVMQRVVVDLFLFVSAFIGGGVEHGLFNNSDSICICII